MKRRSRKHIAFILAAVMMLIAGCQDTVGVSGTVSAGAPGAAPHTALDDSWAEDLSGQGETVSGGRYSKVAEGPDPSANEIDDSELTPITASELNEGQYLITTESSSPAFQVEDTLLVVSGNSMEAMLRLGSHTEWFVYPGSAEDAASDTEDHYIAPAENEAGDQLYTVPVEALDKALPFATYDRPESQWYDRTLLFSSSDLPEEAFKEKKYNTVSDIGIEDGTYYIDVDLEGGTGRADVDSPALLLIQDGVAAALITWSSPNYDYMLIDDIRYDSEVEDEKSTFVIPVKGFDYPMPVIADTTAMSKPHEIEYTLYFDSGTIRFADPEGVAPYYRSMRRKERIYPQYATGFTIDAYDNNIYRINVGKDRYLLVPRLTELPVGIPDSVTVIRTPISRAYMASSSSMDFFTQIDKLDSIAYVSHEAEKWTDPVVSAKVKNEEMKYVGKYDAPDYESLITGKADIAIENSMIYHSPETKEKLEEISVPVFVDLTSYEADPRGRVEWIKVYGLLTGEYGKAIRFFNGCCKSIEEETKESEASEKEDTKPAVAFFYINSKGQAGVRKPGDYISKMIEMAGGEYVPKGIKTGKDKTSSSVDMSIEDFYLKAKDADILIYNSTLYGSPESVNDLVKETALLDEFKAVQEGRVYATEDTMFQATCAAADQISDLRSIINDDGKDMTYFKKLK